MSDVTQLLNAIDAGDPKAGDQLLPLVYEELRKLAVVRMANEKPGQTLQPTALVHEAWLKIAGSGTSTGGVYSVSGTIGQPDAGTLRGGGYTLSGGFWGIVVAVQSPGVPLLSVERLGGTVRVFWPKPATDFVLDQSLTATGAWSQVSFPYTTNAADISITVPSPAGNKFYRLRLP